mgnify:CR=1 FL=1
MGKRFLEYISAGIVGAGAYSLIEVIWRGFTHWTMALTGGLCLALIYAIGSEYESTALWKRCLTGCLVITTAELWVGFVVNILLGWGVWSYSGRFMNFHGLICPLYTFLWFLLCIPANFVCGGMRRLFGKFR